MCARVCACLYACVGVCTCACMPIFVYMYTQLHSLSVLTTSPLIYTLQGGWQHMDRRCLFGSAITSYPTSPRPFLLEEDWGTVKQRENGERCEGGGRVIVEGVVWWVEGG